VAFRSAMKELDCGYVTTELVSAKGLMFNSEKTRSLMKFEESQGCVGIQIFGETPEDMAFAAKEIEKMGGGFVDLNLGCPVNKVVKKGAGSALLKDLPHLKTVLRTVKSAINIPLTIKVRTGWDADSRNAHEVAQLAYDEGVSWVAIHGRTRAQAYKGKADWEYIADVAAKAPLPIIGNGDIHTAAQARTRLKESGCAGVMIGRGCLKNPWIFKEALHGKCERNFLGLLERLRYHCERHFDERVSMLQYKKLASWYSTGYPDSANLRKTIFRLKERDELYKFTEDYFQSIAHLTQLDTSSEDFLMGGHG